MIRSGKEQLKSIRDGRAVYIGSERVNDVTVHPAFRNAAQSVAAMYDMKAAPENRDIMTFVDEAGDRHSSYFLKPRSRDDLRKRTRTHQIIANSTYGLWGRSPDHVSSFVTAMAMKPEIFARKGAQFATNIENFYRRLRAEDANATYAVVSPQAARDPEFYQRTSAKLPSFRVVDEKDDGIIVSGMKMLATGGVFSNYIFVGNIFPLAKDQLKESVTCAVPVGAPGVSLWSRKPLERHAQNQFEVAARLAVRRNRFHGDLRKRQNPLGVRLHQGQFGAVARDLHRDAGAFLWQSSVERSLSVQAEAHCRACQQDRQGLGGGWHSGGARRIWAGWPRWRRCWVEILQVRSRPPRIGATASSATTAA